MYHGARRMRWRDERQPRHTADHDVRGLHTAHRDVRVERNPVPMTSTVVPPAVEPREGVRAVINAWACAQAGAAPAATMTRAASSVRMRVMSILLLEAGRRRTPTPRAGVTLCERRSPHVDFNDCVHARRTSAVVAGPTSPEVPQQARTPNPADCRACGAERPGGVAPAGRVRAGTPRPAVGGSNVRGLEPAAPVRTPRRAQRREQRVRLTRGHAPPIITAASSRADPSRPTRAGRWRSGPSPARPRSAAASRRGSRPPR